MKNGNIILGATALARMLKVSRVTLYTYIKKGLPCHRISQKKLAFDVEEVNSWFKRNDFYENN